MINIYENEDIWRVKNRYNENGSYDGEGMYVMPLPEDKRLRHNDPAICLGNMTFQKHWNLFTECTYIC